MTNVLTKQIRERIESQGENTLYMVRDFADLNNDGLVTRALSRLEDEGMLVRLSQGIYLYPQRNRFGILKPSIDDIAAAIAQKDKARIIPSGLTALNKLGLSTQVTMNAVYLTDATAREIKIGNRTIVFKRSAPRNFAYKTDIFPLVVCAMKEIGEHNITDDYLVIIKDAIDKCEDKEAVRYDYSIAPGWIRKRLKVYDSLDATLK